jgi:Protein of unknown function (DUF1501)
MHCRRYAKSPINRREMLTQAANGFGALAFAALTAQGQARSVMADEPSRPPHHEPKARSVIFLFMDGGPSQVDTFDPKPRLDREHGRKIAMDTPPTQFNDVGTVLKCPWKFRHYGQSGLQVSDLFANIGRHADDLAVIRSMTSNFSEHTAANYFMHTGSGLQGRPSAGAWVTYGLGSECQDLPGFVVLNSGLIPPGGLDCFHSGFLPATFQGSVFKAGAQAVENIKPCDDQVSKLGLLERLDADASRRFGNPDAIEAAIANYELAARMQVAVPNLMAIEGESAATRRLYGLDSDFPPTQLYGRQCLVARRLVERGVRFVEVLCPAVGGDRWDQHSNLRDGHQNNARAVDLPIAGLLTDLKARGLLDSTLVVYGGEFGRTPMAQGSDGRDHNPYGFTMWLAGGGSKGGAIVGATDDYGYYAVENKANVHDLHATILHLLGVDHKRLTLRFGGRDMRLTDVHGELVSGLIA